MSANTRDFISVHDDDLVLYPAATRAAMREAMARAFEYLATLCVPGEDVEEVNTETGEIRMRTLRIVVGRDRDDKTVKQRKFYHGVILKQIAEQARDEDGKAYALAIWKEFMRKKFLGVNGLKWVSYKAPGEKRARPHAERVSSEDCSVKQYSTLIDQVEAYAVTELGVVFDIDPTEREAVRWVSRRKAKKAEEATA